MEHVLEGSFKMLDFFLNLTKWAALRLIWLLVTTCGYILRTGFVGMRLGTNIEAIYAQVNTIFGALVQSVTHAVGVIPETLKPLVQISLFSLVQYAIERLHETVPQFFVHLIQNDNGLKTMKDTVEGVFKDVFTTKNVDPETKPSKADISHAAQTMKTSLHIGRVVTTAYMKKHVDAWRKRSKPSPSMKELVHLCMTTKDKHKSKCSGITKVELRKRMEPYLQLLNTFTGT